MYQKYLRYALYGTLILTAVVPLVYIGGLLYPFVTVRALLFRILVSLATLLFAGSVATGALKPPFAILKKPITWLPLGLLVWSTIASTCGVDFYHSFWSSFNRMDGLISDIYYIIYFYILLLTFKQKQWQWFFKMVGVVSLVVAGSAILEKLQFITFSPLAGTGRVGGLINNAAFLASYLTITSFISLWYAFQEKGWERLLWAFVAGLGFFTIFLSATRGAAVGLIMALFTALVLGLWRPSVRRVAIGGLFVVVLLVVGGFIFRPTLEQSNISIVSRLASIGKTDVTTNSRLFVWQNTLKASLSRPVFGYGIENFEYVYNSFYDPTVLTEDWFDRSHNSYLDALVSTGFPGLIFYLGMFVAVGFLLKTLSKKNPTEAFFLTLLFTAYVTQDFFVFDTINTMYLFYALLAYLVVRTSEVRSGEKSRFKMAASVSVVLAVPICVALYWTVILPFRANQALAEAYTYQVVDVPRSLAALERGLSHDTFADMEYGYQLYDMYFVKLAYKDNLEKGELNTAYFFSVAKLQELIDKYPWNGRLYVYLGHIIDQRPQNVGVDDIWFIDMLQKGITLSPKRSQLYYTLVNIYLRQIGAEFGNQKDTELRNKALAILESYVVQVPNLSEPNLILADVLRDAGLIEESNRYFLKGVEMYRGEESAAKRIVSVYLNDKKYAEALPFLKRVIRSDLGNDDLQFDLAKVYYLTGDVDAAVEILNVLDAKDSPALSREPDVVNQILNSYKNK